MDLANASVRVPFFKYHPDPIVTGSAVFVDHVCSVCGEHREARYGGPSYGHDAQSLCLHCISSGAAERTLAMTLDDGVAVRLPLFSDAVEVPRNVPRAVVDEITLRTPGFSAWQDAFWLYHCDDGTAFLGRAGYRELEPFPDALDSLRASVRSLGWSEVDKERFLRDLDRDGVATAYLFRCLHCGTHLAWWDAS